MKPAAPMVSIITVNYNETATTCALLNSIRQQTYPDVEIIVVDNASRPDPAPIFQAQYPEVTFIRSEQNLGFAGGNNLALSAARGTYLFFVNNDAELTVGCIESLLQLLKEQPQAGIVSPLICFPPLPPPGLVQYAGMTRVSPFTGRNRTLGDHEMDQGQFSAPAHTGYAHGAAMMVPRKVLDQVGSMWNGFFLYYEELDWCERIRKAGYEVWIEPRARVIHKESVTLEKMGMTKIYYLTRNRILFMRRNFAYPELAVFFLFICLVSLPKSSVQYLLKGNFRALKAYLSGLFSGFFINSSAVPMP